MKEATQIFNFKRGLDGEINQALIRIHQYAKWKDYKEYVNQPDNPNNLAWVQMGVCMAWEASNLPEDGAYSKDWMADTWKEWTSDRQSRGVKTPFEIQNRWSDNINPPEDEAVTPVQAWVLRPTEDNVTRNQLELARSEFRTFCDGKMKNDNVGIVILEDVKPEEITIEDDEITVEVAQEEIPADALSAEISPQETAADLIARSINGPNLLETRWGVGSDGHALLQESARYESGDYARRVKELGLKAQRIREKHKLVMEDVTRDYDKVSFSLSVVAVGTEGDKQLMHYSIKIEPHRQTTYQEYIEFVNKVKQEADEGVYDDLEV